MKRKFTNLADSRQFLEFFVLLSFKDLRIWTHANTAQSGESGSVEATDKLKE